MGVYSTVYVTRNDATHAIIGWLLTTSDEDIAQLLFDIKGREGAEGTMLTRFTIVTDYDCLEYSETYPGRN